MIYYVSAKTEQGGYGRYINNIFLGKAFEPNQKCENRDGSPIRVDSDLLGNKRNEKAIPGAFQRVTTKFKLI